MEQKALFHGRLLFVEMHEDQFGPCEKNNALTVIPAGDTIPTLFMCDIGSLFHEPVWAVK
jgi:hypothetical protein